MNKIKCENKMKEMGLWYDMLVANDGYYYSIYPNKDKHWFPLIGVHSTCTDTRGYLDDTPKMKTVWKSLWDELNGEDLEPEYCGCKDCCAFDDETN